MPLEVLRISTVVDTDEMHHSVEPLEVLRISTVVDPMLAPVFLILWKC